MDPLCPKYLLPSASEVVMDPGRKFMRDTLEIQDINGKHKHSWTAKPRNERDMIEGSSPSKLTK